MGWKNFGGNGNRVQSTGNGLDWQKSTGTGTGWVWKKFIRMEQG